MAGMWYTVVNLRERILVVLSSGPSEGLGIDLLIDELMQDIALTSVKLNRFRSKYIF